MEDNDVDIHSDRAEASEKDTERNLTPMPGRHDNAIIGGAIGLVGGAVVGGAAGGPVGAVIGAVVGAIASDVAVEGVEHVTHTPPLSDSSDSNAGASTPAFDAQTGVTQHDYTIGDVSATDHTIFGSNGNETVDESNTDPPQYRSVKPNE